MSRRLTLLVEVALAVVLVLGVSGFARSDHGVQLVVDGQQIQVETRAATVGEVLADQGVVVSDRDFVEPSPDSSLSDVDTITVRRARQLQVVVDGQPTQVWTTALTADDALDQIGMRAADAALVVSRSGRLPLTGARLGVRLPDQVSVVHDQRSTTVVTTARTVADVLAESGVRLRRDDLVSEPLGREVQTGMQIVVTRVDLRTLRRAFSIDHQVIRRPDADLYVGEEKVVQRGRDGAGVVITRVVTHDGVVVARRQVDRKVTRDPVREIVRYGTTPRPFSAPATGAEGLNWAALAACESGGNPRAVNPAGYYGLYQFSLSTWASVGGSGNPIDATPAEQTYRAQVLFQRSGASPWPVCGPLLFS